MRHTVRRLQSWLISDVRRKMNAQFINLARIVGELLVTGPIIIYFPFSLLMAPVLIGRMFVADRTEQLGAFSVVFGAVGLSSLYIAILEPLSSVRTSAKFGITIVGGLICGLLATGSMVLAGDPGHRIIDQWDVWYTWFFGGPVVVAVVKIVLILKGPNKSPEPTATAVTAPANEGK